MLERSFNYDVMIKIEQCASQIVGSSRRLVGLVKLKQIVRIIEALDLQANPRDSKLSQITSDIIESLSKTPDLFPLKSKGILLAASTYRELDRDRFELTFVDKTVEGVLDGGHNLLAIGHYVLGLAFADQEDLTKELRKAKIWADFKRVFNKHIANINAYLADDENLEELSALIPVELLLPKSEEPLDLDDFSRSLIDIQEARNNNAQLKQETKTNNEGLYDALKSVLPKELEEKVEWRSNEGADIKAADIVALTWIALSALDLEVEDEDNRRVVPPTPVQTYSSKGDCVYRFHRFMSSPQVTTNNAKRELKSLKVRSAFKVAADIPYLYDFIYENFPDYYNSNDGKFGRISAVNKMNSKGGSKRTKFSQKAIAWKYPEGFIAPLVYGLRSLMEKDSEGMLRWATDPNLFLKNYLPQVVTRYKQLLEENDFDPQKVGKSHVAYDSVRDAFELALLRGIKN
jgi:hypothetical protein